MAYGDSTNAGWQPDLHIDVLVERAKRRAMLAHDEARERREEELRERETEKLSETSTHQTS